MCNSNHPNFLAGFVQTVCYEKDKAVYCDLCELWVNIKKTLSLKKVFFILTQQS